MDEPRNEHFYRDKTWELLFEDIRIIKEGQQAQAKDIADIKAQIRWIVGIATGITVVFNIIFLWLKGRITNFLP